MFSPRPETEIGLKRGWNSKFRLSDLSLIWDDKKSPWWTGNWFLVSCRYQSNYRLLWRTWPVCFLVSMTHMKSIPDTHDSYDTPMRLTLPAFVTELCYLCDLQKSHLTHFCNSGHHLFLFARTVLFFSFSQPCQCKLSRFQSSFCGAIWAGAGREYRNPVRASNIWNNTII